MGDTQYLVCEKVRNRGGGKASSFCNIYVTSKYVAVIPLDSKVLKIAQIVVVVIAGLETLGGARGYGTFARAIVWWIIAFILVGLGYIVRAMRVNKYNGMSWGELSKQDIGFAAKHADVAVNLEDSDAIVEIGEYTLRIEKELASKLQKIIKSDM